MNLITPKCELEQSYISYIEELGDDERYPYPLDLDHSQFSKYVDLLNQYSLGKNLPEHMVANTTYWLVNDDDEILGCSHLRHKLNEQLRHAGGHIGLGIRPSARGKGLSKLLLSLTLDKARKIGIKEVHIHCYQDNIKSQRMIESVEGRLDSSVSIDNDSKQVLKYIINNKALKQGNLR